MKEPAMLNRITKTILALAFPVSAAFAANATLDVVITVSIDAAITLAWNQGDDVQLDRTWALANVTLNGVYLNTGAAKVLDGQAAAHNDNLDIKNLSQVPVDIAFSLSESASTWTHVTGIVGGNEVMTDKYCIRLSADGTITTPASVHATTGVVTAGDYELTPAAGTGAVSVTGGTELARNAVKQIDMAFIMPMEVTVNGTVVTVVFTGSAD
jgi:hypothetical protein